MVNLAVIAFLVLTLIWVGRVLGAVAAAGHRAGRARLQAAQSTEPRIPAQRERP